MKDPRKWLAFLGGLYVFAASGYLSLKTFMWLIDVGELGSALGAALLFLALPLAGYLGSTVHEKIMKSGVRYTGANMILEQVALSAVREAVRANDRAGVYARFMDELRNSKTPSVRPESLNAVGFFVKQSAEACELIERWLSYKEIEGTPMAALHDKGEMFFLREAAVAARHELDVYGSMLDDSLPLCGGDTALAYEAVKDSYENNQNEAA